MNAARWRGNMAKRKMKTAEERLADAKVRWIENRFKRYGVLPELTRVLRQFDKRRAARGNVLDLPEESTRRFVIELIQLATR
jgi:hypothetical protein